MADSDGSPSGASRASDGQWYARDVRLSIRGLVAVGLVGACGSTSPPPQPVDPPNPETAAAQASIDAAPPVADAAVADATPPDAAPAATVGKPDFGAKPVAKGTSISLDVRKTATLAGLAFEFVSNNHKHFVGGGSMGMWEFLAKQGGAKQEIHLRSTIEGFDAELVVHGALVVFTHTGYGSFTITHVAAKAPAPLDEEACMKRVETEFGKRSLDRGTDRSYSDQSGVVTFTNSAWTGFCGRYTQRVWFGPPRPQRP